MPIHKHDNKNLLQFENQENIILISNKMKLIYVKMLYSSVNPHN